ncbi:MAG TPA: hypothetical protein VLS48_06250 [Anaerolineales bacterium]|nr:hypothetical protein [Anaerolineales bacterium]
MSIYLLDHALKVDICFEISDSEFDDNVRLCIQEDCPDDERVFRYDETNLYLTPEQARDLAEALIAAANASLMCDSSATAET